MRIEQALVDQSGLDQPERGAQQQDSRPAAPGPKGRLSDQHGHRAVERGKDEQAGQQLHWLAGGLVVADEVLSADRRQE
ncbi:hypothetical protein [Streptomyces sp. NPDC059455]|uniref:hypothetical protein n=1 Tax=Streptomyces sp. NPDC059455 TaxID=3346837 RepID=UPI0036CDC5BD